MTAAFESENWRLIDDSTWVDILVISDEKSRLLGDKFDYPHFAQSLGLNPPQGTFAQLIEMLEELSTDDTRELLDQAARDKNVELDISDDTPIMEAVARLWLQTHKEGGQKIAEVLMLARIGISDQVDATRRKYREFIGDRPLEVQLDKDALEAVIREWCKQKKKDYESVSILSYQRGGEYCFDILRGDPIKRVTEIRNKKASVLSYKPARTDRIRYEPASGRIGIATRSSSLFTVYKNLLGTMLANSAEFFTDGNVCTLQPLLKADGAVFKEYLGIDVHRVDVRQLVWRRGQRDSVIVHGADCFQLLADLGARLTEGAITEAVLSVSLAGRTRPARVKIKVPNQIDIYGAGIQEDVILSFLSAVGIRGASGEQGTAKDLWSLYPHELNEPQWRQIIGSQFDSLIKVRILEPIMLPTVAHPSYPNHPNALTVAKLPGNSVIGVSSDPVIPLRTLSPTDTLGYRVNWQAQGLLVAAALGLSGTPAEIEQGLWQLGQRDFAPGCAMTVFLATRNPVSVWGSLMRQRAGSTKPIVVIPSACSCDIADSVKMALPSRNSDGLLERCVVELKWDQTVPPHLWMAADLIICRGTGRMWYRGVELIALTADSHPFKFALAVAQGNGRIVAIETLAERISVSRQDINQVVKQAKLAFFDAAKNSFKRAGVEYPESTIKTLFESKRSKGYVFTGTARILGVEV